MKFYPLDRLERPDLDPTILPADLRDTAARKEPAEQDVKFWTGDSKPWRNGDNQIIKDLQVIAMEEERMKKIVAEDKSAAPTPDDHADLQHRCGISVEFLLFLTFELNLWSWKTWEIAQFLVKPLTEANGRCRFAHLPFIKPFTGPADVFISHSWGASWGDLVAAACTGASTKRYVWIDTFAVRASSFLNAPPLPLSCVCACDGFGAHTLSPWSHPHRRYGSGLGT